MQPLNLNIRVLRNLLLRYALVWLADTASVAATAAVLPKIYFRQDAPYWYLSPFVVALLLGLLNALVRPILIILFLPITFVTLGSLPFSSTPACSTSPISWLDRS